MRGYLILNFLPPLHLRPEEVNVGSDNRWGLVVIVVEKDHSRTFTSEVS